MSRSPNESLNNSKPDLSLEEILAKAGRPLNRQEMHEFVNDLPPAPDNSYYPNLFRVYPQVWFSIAKGTIELTKPDRRMALKGQSISS
mgnify:CR=1 FL=1